MAKTTTVVIGDTSFLVGMLPIGILRDIDTEMSERPAEDAKPGSAARENFFFNQAIKIISLGLSTLDSKWTIQAVEALPANSVQEVYDARIAILKHAGLVIDKAKKPGEERAEAS